MKKMNRFFSVLVACCMLFSLFGVPVSADDVIASDEIVASSVYSEERDIYIANSLPVYLSIEGEIYEDVEISSPIEIINKKDPEHRVYFITSCDTYIGKLNVTYSAQNNRFVSSFMFDQNDEIDNILKENIPFAIVNTSPGTTALVTEDNMIMLSDVNSDSVNVGTAMDALAPVSLSPVDINYEVNTVSTASINSTEGTDYSVSLSVPYVSNATTSTGDGLCWAACVAAVSNYIKGTSYTALNIYNALNNAYSGTPSGTNEWISRGYTYCGMTCYLRGTMSFFDLYSILHDQGKPAIWGVYPNSSSHDGHAIVLKMLEGGDEYATFGFMDPNTSSTVYVKYDDSDCDMNYFEYVADYDGDGDSDSTYSDYRYTRY